MSCREDLDRTQSARRALVVTPSDSATLGRETRGLYIGTAGTIRVLHTEDSDPVTYPVIIAGMVYPWSVIQVFATGTSASDIIAQF